MVNENSKSAEINRLKAPLKYKGSKVYDSNGNQLACVETFSDLKYIPEPNAGILSEDEILEHAPNSKEAAKIRLSRGVGDNSDVLLIYDYVPPVLGFYYTAAVCLAIPAFYSGNSLWMIFVLILFILPLIYLYYIFNLKQYSATALKSGGNAEPLSKGKKTRKLEDVEPEGSLQSLNKYVVEVEELKDVFDDKEIRVRDVIAKRFEPPQMTYDRFMVTIDKSHELFYHEADGALNIAKYAVEDTPRVERELESKIDTLKSIIDQIEDLTNELVINISSEDKSGDDVKSLIDDMENLIDSVKDYE